MLALISLIVGVVRYMIATMMFAIPSQLVPRNFTGLALGITTGGFFNMAGIFGPIMIGDAYSYRRSLSLPGMMMFIFLIIAAIFGQSMNFK